MRPSDETAPDDRVRTLERRLARERSARREAEEIAERATSELYETIQELTVSKQVAEMLGAVAARANEADSAEAGFRAALESICAYTGWPVGHVFLRSPDDPELLVSSGVWHPADDPRFATFREDTRTTPMRTGIGLPGRTVSSGEPAWIAELARDDNFPRVVSGTACGLVAGFAAPVLVRSDAVAVMEFFATTIQQPDATLLRVVSFVGAQLGRVLEREAAEERLTRQALYDGLTGLPNRMLLIDRLEHSLRRGRRTGDGVHVLYLDIDDFKSINDSGGHAAGDAVLAAVAQRLQAVLRETDSVGRVSTDTVARLGGDEFAIILEDCAAPEVVIERIQQRLREPLAVDDHEVFVNVSIGSTVAESVMGAVPASDVSLAAANIAMHEAKRAGKAQHMAFQPRMQEQARRRHSLGEDLRHALARGELSLVYQPIVELRNAAVVGAEALLRWNHPKHGPVAPDEFIPRAEETGVIVALGAWVLREACRQAASWRAGRAMPFSIAVNISGRQLREPDFVSVVREAVRAAGMDPGDLCLELTESILMERHDDGIAMLTELRSDGLQLAIDDFGTGYSSFGALRRLPVTQLKIDRSFIGHLPEDEESGSIAWAIVRLGHTLGMPVIAEGIETAGQRTALQEYGCDRGQGFLFGPPLTAIDFEAQYLSSASPQVVLPPDEPVRGRRPR